MTIAIVANLAGAGTTRQIDVRGNKNPSSPIGPVSGGVSSTQPPTTVTTAASRPSAPTTPTVAIGRWTGREPVMIYFSGDAGNITGDLKWSAWTTDRAEGHGTWHYLNCLPNCAMGTSTPYPVTITLTDPAAGHFTRLVEQTGDPHGFTVTFVAPYLGQGACTNRNENTCAFA